jgi:hypothetical protein
MSDVEMEVAAIDTNRVITGLTESEIQAEILRVQRVIHSVNRSLSHVVSLSSGGGKSDNPYAAVLVSPLQREFIQRTDSEINRMSEPDLIQEICNTTALLMYYTSYSVEDDSSPLGSFGDNSQKKKLYHVNQSENNNEKLLSPMKQQMQDWRIYLRDLHNQASANSEDRGIYCLCKQTYHGHRPMIQCDSCENWFHLTCVNIMGDELVAVPSYVCPSCKGESAIFGEFFVREDTSVCLTCPLSLDLVKLYSDAHDGLSMVDLSGASDEQMTHLVSRMSEYQLVQEIEKTQSALEKVISQINEVEQKMPVETSPEPHYEDSSPEARSRKPSSPIANVQPLPPAGLTSPGTRNLELSKADVFAVVKRSEGLESGEAILQKKLESLESSPTMVVQTEQAPPTAPLNTAFASADQIPQVYVKEIEPERLVVRVAWRDLPPHIASTRRAGKMIDLCYACSACSFQEGECACCDSCPRLYHPMCLDPPVSSAADLPDQWYCPQCQSRDFQSTSSVASSSPRRKGKRKAEDASPMASLVPPRKRGRPRKKMSV